MQKIVLSLILTLLISWCFKEKVKLKIFSPDFENNSMIPDKFTCIWNDINPELRFTNIPENTQSIVLIMDDMDAPYWEWTHWILWNILPTTKNIDENIIPLQAKIWINSWWEKKYWWPCPPSWTHRYYFRIFALNSILDLQEDISKNWLINAMSWSIIDQAVLIWKYEKK